MQTSCFAAAVVPLLSPKKLCYRHRREPKQLKPTLRRNVKVHAELDRHIISLQCGGGTSIKIPLATQELDMLKATVAQAVATFAEKAKAERPRRWESVECKFQGEGSSLDFMEFFCNPNAHTSAFDAKILVTLRSQGLQILTESTLQEVAAAAQSATPET